MPRNTWQGWQGINDEEREARRLNAEPWEPLPGMTKRRCEVCDYWFATPRTAPKAKCPDCLGAGTRSASI